MDASGEIKPIITDKVADEEIIEGLEKLRNADELDSHSESEELLSAIDLPQVISEITIDAGYVPPNPEMIEKIVTQVEFYFSDANLPNDKFLMQRIKRDKKGFVSVRLINGFNKMKKLGISDADVTYALKSNSTQLQLNTSGKKIKRILPIPQPTQVESGEDLLRRTVLAINIQIFNDESVREVFEHCGKVEEIRLLTGQSPLSPTIATHIKKHFKMNTPDEWGLIRYDTRESAERACRKLTNMGDWRRGLRVLLLVTGNKKSDKNAKPDQRDEAKCKSKSRVMQLSRDESGQSASNSGGSDGDSSGEGVKILKKGGGQITGGKLGRSPLAHELFDKSRLRSSSFDTDRPNLGSSPATNSSSSSPWIQRRQQTLNQSAGGSSPNILSSSPLKALGEGPKKSENILRLPRGPESKGFELKRCLEE